MTKLYLLITLLALMVIEPLDTTAQLLLPVPLNDMYDCMQTAESGAGVCDDFDQIYSDVFWAHWVGRPVEFQEGNPVFGTWALLGCLDDLSYQPPEYSGVCVTAAWRIIWLELRDSDGDGWNDFEDACPNDSTGWLPEHCS